MSEIPKYINFDQYVLGMHRKMIERTNHNINFASDMFKLKKRFMKENAQVVKIDKDFTIISYRK